MYEKDMIKAYILEDQKNLEIALSVSQVQTDIKEKLLNDLRDILHQKCPANITLDWRIDNFANTGSGLAIMQGAFGGKSAIEQFGSVGKI